MDKGSKNQNQKKEIGQSNEQRFNFDKGKSQIENVGHSHDHSDSYKERVKLLEKNSKIEVVRNQNSDGVNFIFNYKREKRENDPENLDTVPPEYFNNPEIQHSPILTDKGELAHFRSIVGSFFNYKVLDFLLG